MKTRSFSVQTFGKPVLSNALGLLLVFCCALFVTNPTTAAPNLYWDPSSAGHAGDGNGNWTTNDIIGTNNVWWNGVADQNWITGSNAIIGASVPGTYYITNNILGGAQLNPNSIIFTNVGTYYIVKDSNPANQGQLSLTPGGGGGPSFSPAIYVGNNINAVINVPWVARSGDLYVGTNASLTFTENTAGSFGGGLSFKGAGPTISTIWVTNGMLGCNFANPSDPTSYNQIRNTSQTGGLTWNITGNAIVNMTARFDISRSGDTGAGANASSVINVGGVGPWVGVSGVLAQLNGNTQNAPGSGATTSTDGSQNIQISRGGAAAVLSLYDGGLISTFTYQNSPNIGVNGKIKIAPDGNGPATFNIYGGILTLGSGPTTTPGFSNPYLTPITFFDGTTPNATASAIFNMSGGVAGVKGLEVGSGANYNATTTNLINISGGKLYLDAESIVLKSTVLGNNFAINLSGGTIGATANWSPACAAPFNLTNINGNITFQTADAGGTPYNISISGKLTGIGGLNKTGGGVLALTGANNYSGATVVSNGTLSVSTINSPTNGSVTLEGATVASGLPVNSVVVAGVGQYWAINGNLTSDTGTPTIDFNYGSFAPSGTAPIQVNGNVAFNVTPLVSVECSALPSGTYPLIKYSGTRSGTLPTAIVSLPSGVSSAVIVDNPGNKSIDLQVTSSITPSLAWGVGNDIWDFSTANWNQSSTLVDYVDGANVKFDDTASGASPITVTLNTNVAPGKISAENATKGYTISGSGAITAGNVVVSGAAGLTLSGTNTYTGGTTVIAPGRLNINYGGDGGANSAIGTGTLTNLLGAKLDNTSGQPVTLQTSIPEFWSDDFTYIGSADFNTGSGPVTLGGGVTLTVNSNTFAVGGIISDNGSGYGLVKNGNGALTLSVANNFSGGVTLNGGTLNINVDGAVGSGTLILGGGATVDNTSGNDVSVTSYNAMKWSSSFVFKGTRNLDLAGTLASVIDLSTMTLTVSSNTLTTEGIINGGNTTMTKDGPGAWTIAGGQPNGAFGININGGTVNLNKNGFLAFAVAANVIAVNTNGSLVILNPNGTQLGGAASINLSGGTVEWNGDYGEIFQSITFNSGVFRNSNGNGEFLIQGGSISLVGTNCNFDLTNSAALTIDGIITNTGSLLLTGNGILTLTSNNTYSGSTVIAGGTLALADPLAIGAGSISNSALINVRSGATLSVTGRGDQTLTLNNGQTLTGKGTINGNLVVSSGATLAPGGTLTTGTLTVNNNVTLNGNLLLNLNRTNSPNSSQLAASGTITYGGSLNVTNSGPALQVGDTFQLFPTGVTGFTSKNLPFTDANGIAYTWTDNIAANGSITVASAGPAINPIPGPIQFNVSGNTLSLSWPTNLGWILQTQTNSLASGLSTNWVNVPGSELVTGTNITINPGNGSAFFRLIKP